MHPVEIEYCGGPVDGGTEQVLSGPHGHPPAWCMVRFAPPKRSALDAGPPPPAEDHKYVLMDDAPRPGRPWRYQWDGGADATWRH